MFKRPKQQGNRKYIAQRHSPKQEARTAKEFGGHVTIGSGNKHMKGDVRIPGLARIENKCTSKKSFSITIDMIKKLRDNAIGYGEIPIIQIDFIDSDGKVLEQVAVAPQKLIEALFNVKTTENTTQEPT